MSDIMTPMPFSALLGHIFGEYEKDTSIFGIRKFYKAAKGRTLSLFGETMETPFGPAAGPHTQLTQNIVTSYLCGSRFFELKTVQKLDGEDLPVSKPCITAADECYNCEWSTELYVPQAFTEYVKAWFLLKILSVEFDLGDLNGFVFNMSVGYDLEGIKLKKIDDFIEGLKNAEKTEVFQECKTITLEWIKNGKFTKFNENHLKAISPRVCQSTTLSTLHGCPPDEIERIAHYLLTEKKVHTFIKCNPTILGYEFARKTLDDLGFDYIAFDDHHFKEDLQFSDAVPMFERLQKIADEKKLQFGIKLTNTFPVDVKENELPSEEMYMSGRSLAPLSLAAAKKISEPFNGKLRISYSGGIDWTNITDVYNAGIWPITLATSLLKPGGYERLVQMGEHFKTQEYTAFSGINLSKLETLASTVAQGQNIAVNNPEYDAYKKSIKPTTSLKLNQTVPLFDCFTAPCSHGCPINQDIPAYLRLNGNGDFDKSLEVIVEKNPLPFMTGTICAHPCMGKCVRTFYENSVHIRAEKLRAAQHSYDKILQSIYENAKNKKTISNKRLAIIGGGPAGISAAYFAAREGIPTTVFEKKETCGGIVRHVIPEFRISAEDIEKDVELARAAGAEIKTGVEIKNVTDLFNQGFTDVIVAIGAWQPAQLSLEGEKAIDAFEFLIDCKKAEQDASFEKEVLKKYGTHIIVIGAGNTAMDTARAAKRIQGVESVQLVYRRTKRYMPAEEEELIMALEDKVELKELLAPITFTKNGTVGTLECEVMKLGEPDASGRRSVITTDKKVTVKASAVIASTGANMETDFCVANGIAMDKRGRPILTNTGETSVAHVFVAGDACRGPATIVEAIADATRVIKALEPEQSKLNFGMFKQLNLNTDRNIPLLKKGFVAHDQKQSDRCLECSTVCEICCDVCPNRANISVMVKGKAQIVHIDGMCNECGNCTTFCPYDSSPYKDKFTLFSRAKDMEDSTNNGFAPLNTDNKTFVVRINQKMYTINIDSPIKEFAELASASDAIDMIKEIWYNKRYLYY